MAGWPLALNAGVNATQLIADGSYIVAARGTRTLIELAQKATTRSKTEATVAVMKAYYAVLEALEARKWKPESESVGLIASTTLVNDAEEQINLLVLKKLLPRGS